MKVFKFGGASIKNATAICKVGDIIRNHQNESLIVVVSAMGKSTNALEEIHQFTLSKKDASPLIVNFMAYHRGIVDELFENRESIYEKMDEWQQYLEEILLETFPNPDQLYDAIVCVGELLSSIIIGQYLNECNIKTTWVDVRKLIQTEDTFRNAKVDWDNTCNNINKYVDCQEGQQVILTQGFIAATDNGKTTTLGREGSDFTGAIFSSCLNTNSFTVWKDVPGILNADPKKNHNTILFEQLSYRQISEMTYYGAKVIHPKTIKPLANKNIPLFVRCFDQPNTAGTKIDNCQVAHSVPVIIFKENQCLVSFRRKDFTFVNEKSISLIFGALHDLSINVHIMQNSAVSFSVCIDYHKGKINRLIDTLKDEFDLLYNAGLDLVTIKNYTKEAINKYIPQGEILLEQKSRNNYRALIG